MSARWGGAARYIAGGTDLVIQMRKTAVAPPAVINLQRLPGLDSIEARDGSITFGALITHRALERSPLLQSELRAVTEGAAVIGGYQVRSVATLGGNLCNASPAADMAPILLALDAEISLAGTDGSVRSMPLDRFLTGPRSTERTPHEIMTEVKVRPPSGRFSSAFLRAGRRRAMEISIVSMTAVVELDEQGRFSDVRLALGAAAPRPVRLRSVERLLLSNTPSPDLFKEAGQLALDYANPIDDLRASAAFRRHLVPTYVMRSLTLCLDRYTGRENARFDA